MRCVKTVKLSTSLKLSFRWKCTAVCKMCGTLKPRRSWVSLLVQGRRRGAVRISVVGFEEKLDSYV